VESIQLQDAELIQPCEEQISIAPIKDLIKPSKFNLRNFKNHCYQNSILQLLFAIVPFRNEIMANSEGQLASAMGKIFHYLDTGENRNQLEDLDCEISKSLDESENANSKFLNGYQEDVVEFLLPLLDAIREETHSEHLLFDGLLGTHIDGLDKKDNFQTFETDPFAVVPLKLCAFTTLEQSLCDFFQEIFFTKEMGRQWDTSDGRTIDAALTRLFQDIPPFLLFHLHRFNFIGGNRVKDSSNFRFSDSIDMAPFTVNTTTPCKYKLAGIVCHQGEARSGHYITYVLNEDGESFVRLDSIRGKMATTISKDDFMKSNDFIKNGYLALYVRTE
jgi:ubiquitin C-terminal hydrolase